MDLRITTGKKLAGLIGNIHFREQSAGGEIDGFGVADDLTIKFLAGILGEFEISTEIGMNRRRIDFGNVDVYADRIGLREGEEQLRGSAIAGIDEIADIDIAFCDDAAERGFHTFEGFEVLKTANVGFV